MQDINSVTLTGNLTADPELRALPNGNQVCNLRLAFNNSKKNPQTQQYEDAPNFIDITVFGNQGASCAQFLTKGSPVAVKGRLQWSSWEDKNGGGTRSKIEVIADGIGGIKFLHRAPQGGYQQQGGYAGQPQGYQQPPAQQGYQQAPPQYQQQPAQGYQQPPPQQAAPPPQQQQQAPPPQQNAQGVPGDTQGLPPAQPPPQGQQPSDDDIPF